MIDYFAGIHFQVHSNILQWGRIPSEGNRNRLNCLGNKDGNSYLSKNVILGEWIPDRCNHFFIEAGPLTLQQYLDFLPNRKQQITLRSLVRAYIPAHLSFDLVLVIPDQEIGPFRLGEGPHNLLGWTSWLDKKKIGQLNRVLLYVHEYKAAVPIE